MATKKIAHVLSDAEQVAAIATRIKRAQGQLGAVARMLEEGRNCEEIVTQMSAVSKVTSFVMPSSEDGQEDGQFTSFLSYMLEDLPCHKLNLGSKKSEGRDKLTKFRVVPHLYHSS